MLTKELSEMTDVEMFHERSYCTTEIVNVNNTGVCSLLAQGDTVVVDTDWSATLRVPLSQTPAGGRLNARIARFLRLDDGRIVEQTNFDCYQPF